MTEDGEAREIRRECEVCRSPLKPDTKFCGSCGAKVEEAPTVREGARQKPTPSTIRRNPVPEKPIPSPAASPRSPRRRHGSGSVVVLLIGVVLLAGGAWILFDPLDLTGTSTASSPEDPTESASQNPGANDPEDTPENEWESESNGEPEAPPDDSGSPPDGFSDLEDPTDNPSSGGFSELDETDNEPDSSSSDFPDSDGFDEEPEYGSTQEFASYYYGAAGDQDWATTYSLLDSSAQAVFSEDEWFSVQSARYASEPTAPVVSTEITSEEAFGGSTVAELLVTYEDGAQAEIAAFGMSTDDGGIRRSLTDDEIEYLMDLTE